MAGVVTNKGKVHLLSLPRDVSPPTDYYVALVTSDIVPTADTNVLGDLTEIAAGNGYTAGGQALPPGIVSFTSLTENDVDDRGELQLKNIEFVASGGAIPPSGNPAAYLVLTDDNATIADRLVYGAWDLGTPGALPDGDTLLIQNSKIYGT